MNDVLSYVVLALILANVIDWYFYGRQRDVSVLESHRRFLVVAAVAVFIVALLGVLHLISGGASDLVFALWVGLLMACNIFWRHKDRPRVESNGRG